MKVITLAKPTRWDEDEKESLQRHPAGKGLVVIICSKISDKYLNVTFTSRNLKEPQTLISRLSWTSKFITLRISQIKTNWHSYISISYARNGQNTKLNFEKVMMKCFFFYKAENRKMFLTLVSPQPLSGCNSIISCHIQRNNILHLLHLVLKMIYLKTESN